MSTSVAMEPDIAKIDDEHQVGKLTQSPPAIIQVASKNRDGNLFTILDHSLQRIEDQASFLRKRFARGIRAILPTFVADKLRIGVERDPSKTKKNTDENEERGNWSNQAEFVISCIGLAVGLGNVWRFPYLCYRNGGGAFLIIYWILSVLVGFPIMVAEQSLGQYTSQGALYCWQFLPIISGIGISMFAVSFLTTVYYDIIITWAVYYLFASFTSQLPWQECDFSSWADYRCEMRKLNCSTGGEHVRGVDGLCYNATEIGLFDDENRFEPTVFSLDEEALILSADAVRSIERNISTVLGVWNETMANDWGINSVLSTDQYYHNYVLGDADPTFGWGNFGSPRWSLVLCLILVWCIVFFTLIRGIKSSGKVVYVTALAPYAVIFTLIIRGCTLPGAYEGVMYFITPDFERIKSPEVWYAAAGQLFYSLSVCWGGMITLSSYNRFNNNIIRDALIVVAADTFTSSAASFAIFSVIGYGARILDRPVDKVAEAGAGLAFVVYPKVLSQLPGAVGFSIIFFLMLICIGLSTLFNDAQTIHTGILDWFPALRKNPRTRNGTLLLVCIVCFLLGLPFLSEGGPALMQLFDEYAATWAVLLIGVLEAISLCWIYGYKNFAKDLRMMMNWLPIIPLYIVEIALWGFITPGVLCFIMFFCWIEYQPRENPVEEGIGWILTWIVAIWMPAKAIWVVATNKGTILERLRAAFRPTEKWGPYLDRFRSQAKHLETLRWKTASAPDSSGGPPEVYRAMSDAGSSSGTIDLDGVETKPIRTKVTMSPLGDTSDTSSCNSSLSSWAPSMAGHIAFTTSKFVISTNGQPLFMASEDHMARGQFREFSFQVRSVYNSAVVMTIHRPGVGCCCCTALDDDRVRVESSSLGAIGYIKPVKYVAVCASEFKLMDADGAEKLLITRPKCIRTGCQTGNQFDVFALEQNQQQPTTIGEISTPARNMRNRTNYNIIFSADLDVKMKSLMVAAALLFDVSYFSR